MLSPLLFPQITLRAISEIKFDIIGMTESKLKSNKNHLTNITLINYHVEQCPAYCPKDGTLLKIETKLLFTRKEMIWKFSKIKCLNQFSVSPGCRIQLWVFLPCFHMLILSLHLLGLDSKSTTLSPEFCICRPRQYDTICWRLDLISGFFVLSWLIVFGGWNQ